MADAVLDSPQQLPIVLTPALVGGSPIYVSGEDAIRLGALNSATGVTLRLTGRFLPANSGRVSVFSHELVPATDRSLSTRSSPLGEGWLIDWSVIASAGTPQIGQCFCVVSLVRGFTATVLDLATLAAGYVTSTQRLTAGLGARATSVDGPGAVRSITGTTPAAGAEITETVPTNAQWELLALFTTFTTSAAVANRIPSLVLDDGANIFYRFGVTATIPASQTRRLLWHPGGLGSIADANNQISHASPIGARLAPAFRIRTITTAIDVADQYSLVQYLVREWIHGA